MHHRIAIVSSNFWPEPTGISQVTWEFAQCLTELGIEVRVATALPFYPDWRIWSDYRGRLWRTERHAGVTIFRAWHWVRPSPGTATRLLHEATLSLLSTWSILRAVSGVRRVFVVTPALTLAFVGLVIGKIRRKPCALVVQDIMPDAAIDLGMLRSPVMIGVSRFLARTLYWLADEIHTLSDGMRRRIVAHGAPPTKVRIVPNTFDPVELAPVPREANQIRKRFAANGRFLVVHSGNMGQKQDLDIILRAAKRLQHEQQIGFVVFGDGACKDSFLDALARSGLESVAYHPLQPRDLVPHILSGADIFLITQRRTVVDIVVPSKLVTAMGAGAMIVAACAAESETARIVRDSGGGVLVEAEDDHALAQAVLAIRDGGIDGAAYRDRARRYALREFARDAVYGRLVRETLDMANAGSGAVG